jgi:hypothetical protein
VVGGVALEEGEGSSPVEEGEGPDEGGVRVIGVGVVGLLVNEGLVEVGDFGGLAAVEEPGGDGDLFEEEGFDCGSAGGGVEDGVEEEVEVLAVFGGALFAFGGDGAAGFGSVGAGCLFLLFGTHELSCPGKG